MTTRLTGEILFLPNLPGAFDKEIEFLCRKTALEPDTIPRFWLVDWDPGHPEIDPPDRGLVPNMRGLLTLGPHGHHPSRFGRSLTLDFQVDNRELQVERFLAWSRGYSERWDLNYERGSYEFPVEKTRYGFNVGGREIETITTLDIMEESIESQERKRLHE